MQQKENINKFKGKSKKNLREINSYKIQFKNRNNNETNNRIKLQKQKNNNNYISSHLNYSAKTFIQRPIKSNKDLNSQSLNNHYENEKNNISYSNFENSDINVLMKKEKDKMKTFSDYKLSRNDKDMDLGIDQNKYLKMDIKELSDSYNTKTNNENINGNEKDFKISSENRTIESKLNQKKKEYVRKENNSNKELLTINKKYLNDQNRNNNNIDRNINSKIFKKKINSKNLKNIKGNNNRELNPNKKRKNILIEDEKNNDSREVNELLENEVNNKNYIRIKEYFQTNKINDFPIKEKNSLKNEINNKFLYKEIDEKFNTLYSKITKKKEDSKIDESPFEENISSNKLFRVTYPNLKRYRQKSEPNIKVDICKLCPKDEIINIKNNGDVYKVKFPRINIINTNLSKFITLEEKIRNENSTKRKINNLLNKQNNPELKEILSNLQTTMNKFPKNEENKNNYLSTLPANYFSPFDTLQIEKNNYNSKNLNLKYEINSYHYNSKNSHHNKKMEKFKSAFEDFKKIINENNIRKNINNMKYSYQTRVIYSILSPVNHLDDNIFTLES